MRRGEADANRVNVGPVALTQGAPEKMATQRSPLNAEQPGLAYQYAGKGQRLYNVELNAIDDKSAQQPAFQVSYRYPGEERDERAGRRRPDSASGSRNGKTASVQKALNSAQTPRNWSYTKYPAKAVSTLFPPILLTTMAALRSSASPV